MAAPAMQILALKAAVRAVRRGIRRRDPNCWGEHLDIIRLRFHCDPAANAAVMKDLIAVIDPLVQLAAQCDAVACLQVLHALECPLHRVGYPDGSSLLHRAAQHGAARVIAWLLDEQILAVELEGRRALTALHCAARAGQADVARLLIERSAFLEAPSSYGDTPLHMALAFRQEAVAGLLITAGANVGATNRYGDTPLASAARAGLTHSVKLLLNRGAPMITALPLLVGHADAAIAQHPKVLEAPLRGCDPHQIAQFFKSADAALAADLLSRGADRITAAVYALANDQHDVLALIFHQGPISFSGAHYLSALMSARGTRQLLDYGGDPNFKLECPCDLRHTSLLRCAVTDLRADPTSISLLLQHGARPGPPPDETAAPLLIELAVRRARQPWLIREYLAHGGSLDERTADGDTALHALAKRHWDDAASAMMHELLRLGMNIDVRNPTGQTPLMHCVSDSYLHSRLPAATVFLAAGASVTATTTDDRTVLHQFFLRLPVRTYETHSDHAALLLEVLLSHGADVHAQDRQGSYPEQVGNPDARADLRNSVSRLRSRQKLARHPERAARAQPRMR